MILVVMGVSGVGKTTLGAALGRALGARFIEGDAYHPKENLEKMARGEPLDDEDRRPWLLALSEEIRRMAAAELDAVIACSALRRVYRDQLRQGAEGLRFLFLTGSAELISARLSSRRGHFMPPALLASQLETLEPPRAEEAAVTVEVDGPLEEVLEAALEALGAVLQ